VTVTWLPGGEGAPPRVAYAIGRSVGGAVVRNRLKRRLRAVMGELAGSIPAGAWLVGAGAAAVDMTYDELKASVAEVLSAIASEPAR